MGILQSPPCLFYRSKTARRTIHFHRGVATLLDCHSRAVGQRRELFGNVFLTFLITTLYVVSCFCERPRRVALTRRAERECVPLALPVFWRVGVACRRGRKRGLLRRVSALEVALGYDFTSNGQHLSTPAVGDSPFIESHALAEKFQAPHWRSQWHPAPQVIGPGPFPGGCEPSETPYNILTRVSRGNRIPLPDPHGLLELRAQLR